MNDIEFIPYEQALALKGLGFDEECFSFYNAIGELYESEGYYSYLKNVLQFEVVAPLYQQAFRWFREKHGLWQFIEFDDNHYNPVVQSSLVHYCDTYEEAELACLKKLIELLTPTQL
jgi:hypothetical protein